MRLPFCPCLQMYYLLLLAGIINAGFVMTFTVSFQLKHLETFCKWDCDHVIGFPDWSLPIPWVKFRHQDSLNFGEVENYYMRISKKLSCMVTWIGHLSLCYYIMEAKNPLHAIIFAKPTRTEVTDVYVAFHSNPQWGVHYVNTCANCLTYVLLPRQSSHHWS